MSRLAAPLAGSDVRWTGPALALIAVNCIPLVGVLWWGWSLFEIVALYWFENVVIGAINILKMVTCAPSPQALQQAASQGASRKRMVENYLQRRAAASGQPLSLSIPAASAVGHHAIKCFLVPFFTVHYGMFCLVHGIFVFVLLAGGGGGGFGGARPGAVMPGAVMPGAVMPGVAMPGVGGPVAMLQSMLAEVLSGGLLIAALALILSHLYSYVFHYLGQGEYRQTNVGVLMFSPYGRIVVLHLAILFGAVATLFLGQPVMLVILLIVGKTVLDWLLHLQRHRQQPSQTESDAESGPPDPLWQQQPQPGSGPLV